MPITITSTANNIEMAINACRSETGNLLQNREKLQEVKEIEGYCDASGRADNLLSAGTWIECPFFFYFTIHVGQMGPVKIYISEGDPAATLFPLKQLTRLNVIDVPSSQRQDFMRIKQDSIARFIHIMTPLASIYQLPLTCLHIFYDLEGGIIALNRNGSLFLNLRYFEAWRKYIQVFRSSSCWFCLQTTWMSKEESWNQRIPLGECQKSSDTVKINNWTGTTPLLTRLHITLCNPIILNMNSTFQLFVKSIRWTSVNFFLRLHNTSVH